MCGSSLFEYGGNTVAGSMRASVREIQPIVENTACVDSKAKISTCLDSTIPFSTRFSLGMESKRADTGRDNQTCFVRPNSQAEKERR